MKTLHIIFEGLDGSGKTTQIEILRNRLQSYLSDRTIDGRKLKFAIETVVDCKTFPDKYIEDLEDCRVSLSWHNALGLDLDAPQTDFDKTYRRAHWMRFLRTFTYEHILNVMQENRIMDKDLLVILQDRSYVSTAVYNYGDITSSANEQIRTFSGVQDFETKIIYLKTGHKEFMDRVVFARDIYENVDNLKEFEKRYDMLIHNFVNCISIDAREPLSVVSDSIFKLATVYWLKGVGDDPNS